MGGHLKYLPAEDDNIQQVSLLHYINCFEGI